MQGVGILEKDVNGDVLLAWCFPALDKSIQQVLKYRSGLSEEMLEVPFRFSKYKASWLYQHSAPVNSSKNAKVIGVSVCVVSTIFNPAKYSAMLECLVAVYLEGGECSPLPVLSSYLSVVTSGSIKPSVTGAHTGFDEKAHDDRRALLSPLKDVFELFGADTILIWTAMLLKKRVFAHASKLAELLPLVRSLPLLGAWHRLDWNLLRPYMTLSELELDDLKATGVYVAGFTDPAAVGKVQLYDVFVDISAKSISVAEHAKGDFSLTKLHKDLAQAFLVSAGAENDQGLIKLIASKTKELVGNVASLKTAHDDGSYITFEELEQRKLPPNMDRFLFNVALAEKMTKA